jgi:pSer/pThr/pTyr-binding forkhead associated (FHA) protein
VPLNDVEVSRRQAVVELFGRDMIFLRDLASTNGTYHNGRRVSVSRLRDGDTIGCGKTVMKIRLTR